MSEFVITCCSTCDLSKEHIQKLGVDFGTYHYIIDGVDHIDDLYQSVTPKQFYGAIDAGALPTTSQVTPEELIGVIEPHLKEGRDVLHIEFSSGLSGGYASALAAQKILAEKYPERKLYLVDSLAASSGYGLLVDKAVELKNGGMGIDELRDWLEENKLRLRHWFFSTNLQHFRRGGRISGASAAIGTLLGVCPVMDVNSEGKLIVRKKAMGKKKAIREMFSIMCVQAQGGSDYSEKVFMSTSMAYDDAKAIAALAEASFPKMNGKVEINDIGTVIGSHTGPGTVALFFFSSDKRGI